jgi:hypothetical protein
MRRINSDLIMQPPSSKRVAGAGHSRQGAAGYKLARSLGPPNGADRLVSLHNLEEDLRANSLAAIEADPALSDYSFAAEVAASLLLFH